MAYTENKSPNNLDALTSLDTGDLVIVADASDSYRAKKITEANLLDTKADLASPTFTGTPVLPTGTTGVTQSASDNSTKLATTAYVDSAVSTVPSSVSIMPRPAISLYATPQVNKALADKTTMILGLVSIPYKITANQISASVSQSTDTVAFGFALYSEDGQTRLFNVTGADIAAVTAPYTIALSSVVINAGMYWIGVYVASGTINSSNVRCYDITNTDASYVLGTATTGKAVMVGSVTITSSTAPATITPASITAGTDSCAVFRLDN